LTELLQASADWRTSCNMSGRTTCTGSSRRSWSHRNMLISSQTTVAEIRQCLLMAHNGTRRDGNTVGLCVKRGQWEKLWRRFPKTCYCKKRCT